MLVGACILREKYFNDVLIEYCHVFHFGFSSTSLEFCYLVSIANFLHPGLMARLYYFGI